MAKKAMSKPKPTGDERTLNDRMVEGWKDRIEETMKRERFSMRQLGMRAGMGQTSIRHLLTQAETCTLDTMRRLSNAMGVSVVWLSYGVGSLESVGSEPLNVKVIPVRDPDAATSDSEEGMRGYVPVPSSKYPKDVRALAILNSAMETVGQTVTVPQECVLLRGDVVLWSPSVAAEPGDLAVLARPGEPALVRRLVLDENGQRWMVANSQAHGRLHLTQKDRPAAVLAVYRNLVT